MTYAEREAAAHVTNIENAILYSLREGGLDEDDVFMHSLFESLLNHLINLK